MIQNSIAAVGVLDEQLQPTDSFVSHYALVSNDKSYTYIIALFYGFGYRSVDEALNRTSIWATSWRESFEGFLGMEDRPSKTHPEVIATKHMNEEEELNYLYENYIKEPEDNTQQQDLYQNETKK